MKQLIFVFCLILSLSSHASSLVGKTFSSKSEFLEKVQEVDEWPLDSLRFFSIKLREGGKGNDFLVQSRESCGRGVCPSYVVSQEQGRVKVLAFVGAAPRVEKKLHHGYFDLTVVQRSGHANLFDSVKTSYRFDGKVYAPVAK